MYNVYLLDCTWTCMSIQTCVQAYTFSTCACVYDNETEE